MMAGPHGSPGFVEQQPPWSRAEEPNDGDAEKYARILEEVIKCKCIVLFIFGHEPNP
jgi:hypothetical protein